ncbi:MAG: N-acetylmuramoyl-L-alanine amidase [Candidatus Gracilibacteria bacterium]|nr:N-acetylmuramoyl-L-alanine amidase [Candidatus Gracilibacteria bacterium]
MKKIKLFISFFLVFAVACGFLYNLKLQKNYTYDTQTLSLKTNFKTNFKEEASLNNEISPVKGTWTDSNTVNSNTSFDTIYFKMPKKAEFETYGYKAKLKIIVDGQTYNPEIDEDGDERLLTDSDIHFTPVFLNKEVKNFSYELSFTDKNLIVPSLAISTLDSKSFTYKLALKTPETEADDIGIIKRADWGAVEDYRYKDSKYWKSYYDKLASATGGITVAQQAEIDKINKINNYLNTNYSEDSKVLETITSENGHSLVRPIQRTQFVKAIIIHHTDTQDISKPSDQILRGIYYYHSVQNGRGDIGYNYIVGQDGKIYEGKAGGDYVVGSHTLRNNKSNVSISVIGNYQNNYLTEEQQASINKLVGYLAKKYGIDLDKQRVYHKSCLSSSNCTNPLVNVTRASLIGHRDAGYTTCPGDNRYGLLANFKESNIDLSSGNKFIPNLASMKVYEANQAKIAVAQTVIANTGISLVASISTQTPIISNGFDKNNVIKVKLSYPENQNTISLKSLDKTYDLEMTNGQLYNNGVLVSGKLKIGDLNGITEITSWSRIPAWDTKKIYNDNKFRGIITLYTENSKLVVVNELYLNDYLKGIGEISNDALEQKAKTILISARTYARWYMSANNRKFPGKYYDGSDDPNIFQKYLGYGMEQRNTNIVKFLGDTLDEVITYNGKLVKPWYFNQSNGKTLSYYDYCLKNNPGKNDYCKLGQTTNYPYLLGVSDPAGEGKTTLGHGVGLSGDGATYFAKMGWDYKKIIAYYYSGVQVVKLETNTYNPIVEIKTTDTTTSNETVGNAGLNSLRTIKTTTQTTSTAKIFTDIASSNKYYTSLKYFKDKNTLTGFSDGTFRPLNNITRIEALKIILTSFGYAKIDNKTSIFTDIATKTWENAYIQRAMLLSLVDTKNKTFSPSRNINRVEVLKMIMTLKKVDISLYKTKVYYIKDVAKTDWYYPYAVYALENKLFTLNSGYFYPSQVVGRGELIDVMYKLK